MQVNVISSERDTRVFCRISSHWLVDVGSRRTIAEYSYFIALHC